MDTEVEVRAKELGWKPDGELPAQEWLDKGDQIHGSVKRHRDQLKNELDAANAKIGQMQETNREFGQYMQEQREKDNQSSRDKIADLEGQLASAFDESDGRKAVNIQRQIRQEEGNIKEPQQQDLSQVFADWKAQNQWFNTDEVRATYAEGAIERLNAQGWPAGQSQLEEAARLTKIAFPDKFTNSNRSGHNDVEQGGSQGIEETSNARNYDNLPDEAKAWCNKFVDDGLMTRDEYVKTYDGDWK